MKALVKLPLSGLLLGNTTVTDLEPLRGMALRKLYLFNSKVTDLSPLQGMPLDRLSVSGTKVTDISAFRGMPRTYLRLHRCTDLTELSPLEECKTLATLMLPPSAKNIEFLRSLPKLTEIGFKDDPKNGYRAEKIATEFWQEYDAQKQ